MTPVQWCLMHGISTLVENHLLERISKHEKYARINKKCFRISDWLEMTFFFVSSGSLHLNQSVKLTGSSAELIPWSFRSDGDHCCHGNCGWRLAQFPHQRSITICRSQLVDGPWLELCLSSFFYNVEYSIARSFEYWNYSTLPEEIKK